MLREKIRETLKSAKLLEEVEEGDVWAFTYQFPSGYGFVLVKGDRVAVKGTSSRPLDLREEIDFEKRAGNL